MRGQRSVRSRNARRLSSRSITSGRNVLDVVIAGPEIDIADRRVVLAGTAVGRYERHVITSAEIQSQPVGKSPLILEEESIHPTAVLGFILVPIGIAGRNSQQQRGKAESTASGRNLACRLRLIEIQMIGVEGLL